MRGDKRAAGAKEGQRVCVRLMDVLSLFHAFFSFFFASVNIVRRATCARAAHFFFIPFCPRASPHRLRPSFPVLETLMGCCQRVPQDAGRTQKTMSIVRLRSCNLACCLCAGCV